MSIWKILSVFLIVLVASVVSAYVLIYVADLALMNNADGRHVLRSAFVAPADMSVWQRFSDSFPMLPISDVKFAEYVPVNISGLVTMIIAVASKLLGSERFYVLFLTAVYFATFFVGCFLLIQLAEGLVEKVSVALISACVMVNPYVVSYFFSPYEEAAVFALLPLWVYLGMMAFRFERKVWVFFIVTMLLVLSKANMIVFIFVPLVFCVVHKQIRYAAMFTPVLAVSFISLAVSQHFRDAPNSFNRVYNGLAYSVSDVSQWPAQDFKARAAVAADFVRPTEFWRTDLPIFTKRMWGHSYWPDVFENSAAEMKAYTHFGSMPKYMSMLGGHPYLAFKVVAESLKTALKADYALNYIAQPNPRGEAAAYRTVFRDIQANFGLLIIVGVPLLVFSVFGSSYFSSAVLLVAMGAPVFVVLGDGYYEFEKHLLPYLVFIIFAAPAAVHRVVRLKDGPVVAKGV